MPGDGRGGATPLQPGSGECAGRDEAARAGAERLRARIADVARRAGRGPVRANAGSAAATDRRTGRGDVGSLRAWQPRQPRQPWRPGRGLATGLALVALVTGRAGAERPLPLREAVRMALQKNETLVIDHEAVVAASANVRGAQGAYDPVLELKGSWSRSLEPLNVGFPGVSRPQITPEVETAEAGAAIRKQLNTGGALLVHASGLRQTSDQLSTLLSPAYGTRVGVELRQPLWRNLTMDDARLQVRRARSAHDAATAVFERSVSETVAAVERAY